MMKANLLRRSKRRSSVDESGFTLVEMVVAIPVVLLVLGIVFSSIGVTIGLMAQVTEGAGASRIANNAMDQLSAARNCAEISAVVNTLSAANYDSSYLLSFPSFTSTTCKANLAFPVSFDVKDRSSNTTYYSETVTLLAV